MAETGGELLLAINRCLALLSEEFAESLFGGCVIFIGLKLFNITKKVLNFLSNILKIKLFFLNIINFNRKKWKIDLFLAINPNSTRNLLFNLDAVIPL